MRCQPADDRGQVGRFGVDEEKGQGGRSPARQDVGSACVAREDFDERRQGEFPRIGRGGLDGEAHERDAVTQAPSFLDLKVDEEAKHQIVDDPCSGVGLRPEAMPFAHDRVFGARRGTLS